MGYGQMGYGQMRSGQIELRGDLTRVIVAAVLLFLAAFVACLMLVLVLFGFAFGLVAVGIWQWAAFLIVAGVCLVLISLAALIAILRIRGLSGLRETRTTVQETLTVLRGGDKKPEITAPARR